MQRDANNSKLQSILSNWQHLPIQEQPALLKTFTAGLNHQTYLIGSREDKYVLKLFTEPNRPAIKAQQWAAQHSLAPRVLYASDQYDLVLMHYQAGKTAKPGALNTRQLANLAISLRQLHKLPCDNLEPIVGHFDLQQFCQNYLDKIDDPEIHRIHQALQPALELFLNDPTPWCLCHNDLVVDNIFLGQQQSTFIDWEYTQMHNPWFDLAAVIYYLKLDQQQIQRFLFHYNREWQTSKGNIAKSTIVVAAHCAVIWLDVLWHLAKTRLYSVSETQLAIDHLHQLVEKLKTSE